MKCRPGIAHPCISEKHACNYDQYCKPILEVNAQNSHPNKYECVDEGSCDTGTINFWSKRKILSNMEILVKNTNFGNESKFPSKIEMLVENVYYG